MNGRLYAIPAGKAFCAFDAGAYPDNASTEDTSYYNLTLYPNWSAANCAVRLDYGIAANSKNPDVAFAVLKELYTDEDICNVTFVVMPFFVATCVICLTFDNMTIIYWQYHRL